MYNDSRQFPGGKPTLERKAELEKASRVSQAAFGHLVGKEDDRPLKFPKHMTVWKDRKGFDCRGKRYDYVWREPDGRFARKPAPGERAQKLGLRSSS